MKSPLKDKPLRNPGESLERYWMDYVMDQVLLYLMVALFMTLLAALEWWRYLQDLPPSPYIYTAMATIVVPVAAYKVWTARKKAHAIRQGIEGEKSVGQYLERLREKQAQVFHDIPGTNFNLDHVVVHESGIYVVETKAYSKPENEAPTITFNGETLLVAGRTPKRDPVKQVRAASSWLRDLLEESTGKRFTVRPVVVFPGWYIEPTAEARRSDVWVLNPKALPGFIDHSRAQLSPDDVRLASYHLSRYIRGFAREAAKKS